MKKGEQPREIAKSQQPILDPFYFECAIYSYFEVEKNEKRLESVREGLELLLKPRITPINDFTGGLYVSQTIVKLLPHNLTRKCVSLIKIINGRCIGITHRHLM